MTTFFARFNVSFDGARNDAEVANRLKEVLHDAATDQGSTDEFEVLFLEALDVVAVAVPFEYSEPWSLFEAGQVLGYVHRYVEQSGVAKGLSFSWSIVDANGKVVESTVDLETLRNTQRM